MQHRYQCAMHDEELLWKWHTLLFEHLGPLGLGALGACQTFRTTKDLAIFRTVTADAVQVHRCQERLICATCR